MDALQNYILFLLMRTHRCFPEFINAAYNAHVDATNTCGLYGPSLFCYQTTSTGAPTVCDVCNQNDSRKAHPAELLTDLNDRGGSTWWQSETLAQNVEREEVNITISFCKFRFIFLLSISSKKAQLVSAF